MTTGGVAHMVERSLRMREARGSIPRTSIYFSAFSAFFLFDIVILGLGLSDGPNMSSWAQLTKMGGGRLELEPKILPRKKWYRVVSSYGPKLESKASTAPGPKRIYRIRLK
ncbi:hypothetical protein SLE2022_296840 [Rubroshorea leprosula]